MGHFNWLELIEVVAGSIISYLTTHGGVTLYKRKKNKPKLSKKQKLELKLIKLNEKEKKPN